MRNYLEITDVIGRQILDSRGNPTVEVEVVVEDISVATVSVTNVVTAVKEGQTKIKLIFDDKVFDEISLVVTANSFVEQEQEVVESIYRITLSASEKRIYINSNFVLTANVYKNNSVCNESVEWIFGENNSIVSTSINGNKISVDNVDSASFIASRFILNAD